MSIIRVYTDGAVSKYKKGDTKKFFGASAFVALADDDSIVHATAKARIDTTISREEMSAIIDALEWFDLESSDISRNAEVKGCNTLEIYSDSEYCVKAWNERMDNWKKKGWKVNSGKPVANLDLVKKLDEFKDYAKEVGIDVSVIHVRAHEGDEFNEYADNLAVKSKLALIAVVEG